jgi:hypothetical protein
MRISQKVAEEVQLILMIVGNGIRSRGCRITILTDNEFTHSYEIHGKDGSLIVLRVLFSPDNIDFQVIPSPKAAGKINSEELQKMVEGLIAGAFSRSILFKSS